MNKQQIRIIKSGCAPHWYRLSKTRKNCLLYFIIGPIYGDRTVNSLLRRYNYKSIYE